MNTAFTGPQPSDQFASAANPSLYRHPAQGQVMAIAKLVGGILLVFFALGMFVLNLFIIRPGMIGLHATTTLPMIMAVFLILAAVASLKNPGQVQLADDALVFQPGPRIAWRDIALANVEEVAGGQQRRLRLIDREGKTLGQIAGSIERFDELVARVRDKVGQHTAPEVTSHVRMKKARRQAVLTAAGAVLLAAAGAFIIHDGFWNRHVQAQLDTAAVDGTGVVTEKFVAPNGITRRIRYRVTGADGQQAEHNVEVEQALFDRVAAGDAVAVRYVPSEPRISRLELGEVLSDDITSSPTVSFVLGSGAIAMSLAVLAAAVMFWKGYDFKIDNEGARFVPLGQ